MAIQLKRYRFSTAEYHRLAEARVLDEDDRVELIEGEIIELSPIGRKHAGNVDRLNRFLGRAVGDEAIVRVQGPIELDPRSEPQPDLALLRPRADFYTSALPAPEDVLLVIEVADTSFEYDRQVKAPLYSRHGIPEYWLLHLDPDHLVVFRDPGPDGYRTSRVLRRGESITPLAFPHLQLSADDLLG